MVGSLAGSKLNPEQQAALGQKVTGFGEFVGDSLKSAGKHLIDPESRALWKEVGVTKPQQSRVAGLLDTVDVDTRAREKAVGNMIYERHIAEQAGHQVESVPEVLDELTKRAFIEDYAPATQEGLAAALGRHRVVDDLGRSHGVTPDEANYVAEKILKRQRVDGSDSFVLKAPTAKETGGHHSDVVHKNPMNKYLKKIFEQHADGNGNVPLATLSEQLGKAGDEVAGLTKREKKVQGDFWRTGRVDPDGVWIEGSKVGSAIVEGGVGFLAKIQPDGTMKVFMQDGHDFFENALKAADAPAKALGGKGILPTQVIAVTPPMVNNIKSIKKGIKANVRDADGNVLKEGRKNVKQTLEGPKYTQVPNRGTPKRKATKTRPESGYTYDDIFAQYGALKPSPEAVAKEKARLAGYGTGAGLLGAGLYRDDR